MIDYGVIIQARMGSSRRPEKVAELIDGEEMLSFQINRLLHNGVSNIGVATTTRKQDDIIEKIAKKCNVQIYRGSENDLIDRFYSAASQFGFMNIVRVGGDDPLIDPECIKALINAHRQIPANFIYASHKKGWIYGTAAELIELNVLKIANDGNATILQKEHIIPLLKGNRHFSQYKIEPQDDQLKRSDIFFSVDYEEDIQLIKSVCVFFKDSNKKYDFSQSELISLYDSGLIEIPNRSLHTGFDE